MRGVTRAPRFTPQLLEAAGGEDERTSATLLLESGVAALHRLSGVADFLDARGMSSTIRGSSEGKIRCLLLARLLRDRAQLEKLVANGVAAGIALKSCTPDSAGNQDFWRERTLANARYASAAQLSRSQLQVDAAFLCWWKDRMLQAGTGPIYLWMDSSPQGGSDWLLTMMDVIDSEHVWECAEAVRFLVASQDTFREAKGKDERDVMLSIAAERDAQARLLGKRIVRHSQAPMALGSGATSLEHKLRCLAQKMYYEAQTDRRTSALLSRVRGLCSDMGVEAGVNDVSGVRLRDVLPPWQRSADEGGLQEDGGDAPEYVQEQAPQHLQQYLLPLSVLSAGLLHIVHNMVNEVDRALSGWSDWLPGFKALATLLSKDALRARMVSHCFKGTRYDSMAPLFKHGVPSAIEWRWGSVVGCLKKMLPLANALRVAWDPQKFSAGGGESQGPRPDVGSDTLDLQLITQTIRSARWWAYSHMVLSLHTMADSFRAWAESCPCHDWLQPVATVQPDVPGQRRCDVFEDDADELMACRIALKLPKAEAPLCPMHGKRAVELASGVVFEMVSDWGQSAMANVWQMCGGLNEQQVDELVADFELGRSHICQYVEHKLSFWTKLPWKLAALGDWSADRARKAGQEILQLFDDAPPSQDLHHRVTWEWLNEHSPIRAELVKFIAGANLKDLPILRKRVGELMPGPQPQIVPAFHDAELPARCLQFVCLARLTTPALALASVMCSLRASGSFRLLSEFKKASIQLCIAMFASRALM